MRLKWFALFIFVQLLLYCLIVPVKISSVPLPNFYKGSVALKTNISFIFDCQPGDKIRYYWYWQNHSSIPGNEDKLEFSIISPNGTVLISKYFTSLGNVVGDYSSYPISCGGNYTVYWTNKNTDGRSIPIYYMVERVIAKPEVRMISLFEVSLIFVCIGIFATVLVSLRMRKY